MRCLRLPPVSLALPRHAMATSSSMVPCLYFFYNSGSLAWPPLPPPAHVGIPALSEHRRRPSLSPRISGANYPGSGAAARAQGTWPAGGSLVSPDDQWGMWTALFAAGGLGLWSEECTPLGKTLSAAVVSTLGGLAASSLRVLPAEGAPAYGVVMEYLLPLAVPLLLFKADLRLILKSTGTLLLAFLLGSENKSLDL